MPSAAPLPMPQPEYELAPDFDLFVSYAHADDRESNAGKLTALVRAIEADYLRVMGTRLRVFFDTHEIRSMDAWEARILTGLRQSKMMVAILSPSYFASAYCRKEWEIYVETELSLALPGEGIAPIYVIPHPAFDADPVEDLLRPWVHDLRRRQYIAWQPFWPEGAAALERADVRRKLADLPGQIAERLRHAAIRDTTPHTVPLPSQHFVGRRDEMHLLLHDLLQSHIGAITAVHGIPGIGKSMLAFAYAWGYGFRYPGGRFLIQAANLTDLASGIIGLAEPKGVALSDAERQSPDVALAKVKAAFEAGPPALLVIDNVDDPALLTAPARERALPKGDHIHVLVTTRVSPEDLPRIRCLALDALQTDDAIALLASFRSIADSPQDAEWKAALEIVGKLGGHALAVEVVAVYLRENPDVSYRAFAERLIDDGIELMDTTAGPEAIDRLAWHTETCIRRLIEPTLASLSPAELRAVEYAAVLPPENIPLPWLRERLAAEFPDLMHHALGDPTMKVLKRLERLRLVVPQARGKDAGTGQAAAGDARLARMHRLVQDVVRARLGADDVARREAIVDQYAYDRAGWIKNHWGQLDLAWELRPLREVALRLIARGDRQCFLMAYRISTPLEHTGRLLEVRDLWRRSVDLFARLSVAAPENSDYAHDLSISYSMLGDLAMSGGDPSTARQYYEDGLKIAKRLSDSAPENADYARDLSVSYERLGNLARSGGDPSQARWYYEDGLKIRKRLSDAAPENAEYARDLSISHNKLGDLAMSGGDPSQAGRYYEDGLKIVKRLSDAAPENAEYARDLSFSYNKLGDLAMSGGDPSSAGRYYKDCLKIAKRLSDAAPENADYARDLSVSYARLGNLARSGGDPSQAGRYYEDGLKIVKRLSDAAPENADYARDLSVSYYKLGDLAKSGGDPSVARRYYEDGLKIAKRLSDAAPENADYARALSVSYYNLGDLAKSGGDPSVARRYYEDGLKIAKRLSDAAPENADYARDVSISYHKLGDLARSGGDPSQARRYYEDDLKIAKRLSDAAPGNADYALDLSRSYSKLGDLAKSGGDPSRARQYYEDSLKIAKRLSDTAPENADYARDLSRSFDRLGDLAMSGGDPPQARRYYEDDLKIVKRLSDAAPENADYAQALSVSYHKLGDLAMSGGDQSEARRYYEDSLKIAKRLSDAARENAEYARDVSISYERLGDLARSGGDPSAARRYYEEMFTIHRRLSAAAPENADYARDLSRSFERLGDLAMYAGDPTKAGRYFEGSLRIRKRLSDAAPENADYTRDVWVSYWRMADVAEKTSRSVDAQSWWRQAYDVLSGMKQRGLFLSPGDERVLEQLAKKVGR